MMTDLENEAAGTTSATASVGATARDRGIPYKDVEGSFAKFTGDDKENVIEWLKDFDVLCACARWGEFYKYVNLLKSLGNLAREFAKCDGGSDYESLRAVLLRRYGRNVTRSKLLRLMAERKKEQNETVADTRKVRGALGITKPSLKMPLQ